jgi:uncharacterized iron-regulated membrane protein
MISSVLMTPDLNFNPLSRPGSKPTRRAIRKGLFWLHLVAGLLAGAVILILCFTGTVLAFEKEIVAWADRAGAQVAVPAEGTPRLTAEQMIAKAEATQPGLRAGSLVVKSDPAAAVTVALGNSTVYVNPYTGAVMPQGATGTRAFMRTMTAWHRYVGFGMENRTTGRQISGAANVIFLVLAATGLYLWMPRRWSWRALRPSVWFTGAKGRARDWNWHNVIGLWSTPVLVVLTLTALPISYSWASGLINRLNGPATPGATAAPAPAIMVPEGATRLSFNVLLLAAQAEVPDWKQITLRLDGGAGGRGGGGPGGAPAGGGRGGRGGEVRGRGNAEGGVARIEMPAARPGGVAPVSLTVREAHSWPRTVNTTLALNPFTAEKVSRTGYAQMAPGQQVRSWTRFLHTGEALGPLGQLAAGLACLGGCFLVYTGFALSWQRFFGRKA